MQSRKVEAEIGPEEWDFDAIPDEHLTACCYWEYARESVFLREFKARCVEANRQPKPLAEAFELCGKDARRVLAIGPVANSFLLGFGFAAEGDGSGRDRTPGSKLQTGRAGAPITGNFPAAWQSLSLRERDYRAELAAGAMPGEVRAFERTAGAEGLNALLMLAGSAWGSTAPLPIEMYREAVQEQLDRLNADAAAGAASPLAAGAPGRVGTEGPSLLRLDRESRLAEEVTVVQIEWGGFSDEELVECFRTWVKANRPAGVGPGGALGRGHRLKDWRANLARLAVMRLLRRFSALELLDPKVGKVPAIWETKQFSGATWYDVVKWHDARREARQLFHQLFPFLPAEDVPISWETGRGRRGGESRGR